VTQSGCIELILFSISCAQVGSPGRWRNTIRVESNETFLWLRKNSCLSPANLPACQNAETQKLSFRLPATSSHAGWRLFIGFWCYQKALSKFLRPGHIDLDLRLTLRQLCPVMWIVRYCWFFCTYEGSLNMWLSTITSSRDFPRGIKSKLSKRLQKVHS